MEILYVLINTNPGALERVYGEIQKKQGVIESSVVTGPYDIVVKIGGNRITDALGVVVGDIRKIDGIRATETLVVVKM